MSARPLRVPLFDLRPGERVLAEAEARYVARVHRLGVGDALELFDPEAGLQAEAHITAAHRGRVACLVHSVCESRFEPYPVTLLQALGKADKPEDVLRAATALGAARIVFLETERTVVQLSSERADGRRARWRRVVSEAARQCGRGRLPVVEGPFPFPSTLAAESAGARWILQAGAPPLGRALAAHRGGEATAPLRLLVGPEGGWTEAELRRAEACGFEPASLGELVLRTELGAVAGLAVAAAHCAEQRWAQGEALPSGSC